MSLLFSVIAKEEARNQNMIDSYSKELEILPKGSIRKKQINGKEYFYLTFRNGKKVVSKYIPQGRVDEVREKLSRRAQVENMIKMLKEEKAQIKKVETIL